MNAMNPVENVKREPLVRRESVYQPRRNAHPIVKENPAAPTDAEIAVEPVWALPLAPKKARVWIPVHPFAMTWPVVMTGVEAHAVPVVKEKTAWREPASRTAFPTVVRLSVETTGAEEHAEPAKKDSHVTLESV